MHSVGLRVPYIIVSSMVKHENEVEKRVQTPFGSVDILLRTSGAHRSLFSISVVVETELSVLSINPLFMNDFLEHLANFSYEIVKKCIAITPPAVYKMEMRVVHGGRVVRLARKSNSHTWIRLREGEESPL